MYATNCGYATEWRMCLIHFQSISICDSRKFYKFLLKLHGMCIRQSRHLENDRISATTSKKLKLSGKEARRR